MRTEPISKLQKEYRKITQIVIDGDPVILTKNGEKYIAMITAEEYARYVEMLEMIKEEKAKRYDEIMQKLDAGAESFENHQGYSTKQMREKFGL